MKTTLALLLLTCVALSAPNPPSGDAPDAANAAAETNAPAVKAATPEGGASALPPPAMRRGRGDASRGGAPAAPGAVPAPSVAIPIPDPAVTAAAASAANAAARNRAVLAPPPAEEEVIIAGGINLTGADLNTVLIKYAEMVNRSVLRAPTLPQPNFFFQNQTPLTKAEAIQAYQALFAMNGVSVIEVGEKFLKVVPAAESSQQGQKPLIVTNAHDLPELGQYVTHIVQLRYVKPTELVPVLTPFQKMANAIFPIDSSQILVLRDFTENVKRMLEMIEKVDVTIQSEFESRVIPIKFAKAEDIASALSSLSGSGQATTVGTRAAGSTGGPSGVGTRPGLGGYQPGATGLNQPGGFGANPAGTPSGGGSFSDRINAIISRAAKTSGSAEFQIIGPNKIVADVRSNSLMIFASRADMTTITNIINQLDIVLAQVKIETIILDVSLSDDYDLGLSYLQKPKSAGDFTGVGALNNVGFLSPGNFSGLTNGAASLGKGFSYFGRFGQDLDVTLTAMANDSSVKVVQRPMILTTHATPGTIFIGSTVPYVSSTYYGGGFGGGPSSSYQQLRVGINLTVTPYVNQDGLVVMKIDEAIDELGDPVPITGVGNVPSTVSRTLSAEVAVRDRETIVLGGFIRSSKTDSKSGVPILKDIPLLGMLFNSTKNTKKRNELMVLMRPTVLRTPEIAAAHTAEVRAELPGIRSAEVENLAEEKKRVEQANRKLGPVIRSEKPTPAQQETNAPQHDAQGFLPPPQ